MKKRIAVNPRGVIGKMESDGEARNKARLISMRKDVAALRDKVGRFILRS